MQYEINVTQEDIDNGAKKQCTMCPIALATKRIFPNADWVSVTTSFIRVCEDKLNDGICYRIPLEVMEFVYNFDKDRPVFPFSFSIDDEKLFV